MNRLQKRTKPDSPEQIKEDAAAKARQFQTLRGMKDVSADDAVRFLFIENSARAMAADYGFRFIETPILEESALFVKTIGRGTDIVEQEMFSFETQGGERVSLRPENTAAIVRAYIQHGMWSLPQPVKLWYWGPFFRYDRPQAGRFRQFHQLGFEILGDAHPMSDALLLIQCAEFCETLGLSVELKVNSIGCPLCRPGYIENLTRYYREHRSALCIECKKRLQKNVLRVLDCKESGCARIKEDAPQSVDYLCEACKDHFMRLLEYLDERDVSYVLEPTLVRGLDYYTRTVFEIFSVSAEEGHSHALGGGGRYDGLVEFLGGRPTAGLGVAFGVERLATALRLSGVAAEKTAEERRVFVAQLGEAARRKALKLYGLLRKEGIPVAQSFSKDSLKAQLEVANSIHAPLALILGQKEVLDETILLRDMEGGVQEIVPYDRVVSEIKRRLAELVGSAPVKALGMKNSEVVDEVNPDEVIEDPVTTHS